MTTQTAPSESYKVSSVGELGGGAHGGVSLHKNATQAALHAHREPRGIHGETSGPQQEIAGTLPTDFRLSNVKAETKGEGHMMPEGGGHFVSAEPSGQRHQPIYAHDVTMPENKPHLQAQTNESSKKPPHKHP